MSSGRVRSEALFAIPFEIELAWLYLFSPRGRGRRSRLVRITAVGVGFGAAALVLTLALLSGFQEAIRREIRAAAPGFRVVASGGGTIAGAVELAGRLSAGLPDVAGASPRRRALVWALGRENGQAAAVGLVEDPRLPVGEAEIDPAASASLSAVAGSTIRIVSPREELGPLGPVPTLRDVVLTGYRPSAPRARGQIFVPPEVAGALLEGAGPGEIEILPARSADLARLRERLEERLRGRPELRLEGADDTQKALSAALALERRVLFASLALVVVVAASGVASELALMAVERRGAAAILLALGASRGAIRRTYLWVGTLAGATGGTIGALLGALVGTILDRTGWIPLPEGLYTISRLPFRVESGDVAAAALLATALAFVASWLPARRAAEESPAEAIRER